MKFLYFFTTLFLLLGLIQADTIVNPYAAAGKEKAEIKKVTKKLNTDGTDTAELNQLEEPQCVCSCECAIPVCPTSAPTTVPITPDPTLSPTAPPTPFPTLAPTEGAGVLGTGETNQPIWWSNTKSNKKKNFNRFH